SYATVLYLAALVVPFTHLLAIAIMAPSFFSVMPFYLLRCSAWPTSHPFLHFFVCSSCLPCFLPFNLLPLALAYFSLSLCSARQPHVLPHNAASLLLSSSLLGSSLTPSYFLHLRVGGIVGGSE
ncbi:hypothetical protein Tco_1339833, partial [Tanacetum coccineum]